MRNITEITIDETVIYFADGGGVNNKTLKRMKQFLFDKKLNIKNK